MGNPSSNIAFGLIAGFIVFITVRGELPAYLCVVGIGSNCPPPASEPSQPKQTQKTPPPTNQPSTPPRQSGGSGGGGGDYPVSIITSPGWPGFSDIQPPADYLDTSNAGIPGLDFPVFEAPPFPDVPVAVDTTIKYGDEDFDPYGGLYTGTYEGGL